MRTRTRTKRKRRKAQRKDTDKIIGIINLLWLFYIALKQNKKER